MWEDFGNDFSWLYCQILRFDWARRKIKLRWREEKQNHKQCFKLERRSKQKRIKNQKYWILFWPLINS